MTKLNPLYDPLLGKVRKSEFSKAEIAAIRELLNGGGSSFNPAGTYPNLTAGNLAPRDSDAVRDERVSFLFRSAAGEQSISDGKAKLTELFGNLVNGVPFNAGQFRSIGFNAFNPENILENYALNSSGEIVATESHTLAIVHVLACSTGNGGNNGYRVRAKKETTCTINRVGYSATEPTTSSTTTVLAATQLTDGRYTYVPSAEGYLIIDIASEEVDNLLVNLAWSYDPEDKDEDYQESIVSLPMAHEWGSAKAGSVYDEINWLDQIITKRVERALMTDMVWEEVVTEQTTQEDIDGTMTDVTVNVYSYKSASLATYIKASTANLVHYGLLNDVSVDENGNVIVASGNTQLDPATAFAGIYLYYELAEAVITPMTDESTYDVNDFGTEEFLGSAIAPTYATFLYLPNLIDQMRAIILNVNQANIREEKLLFENTASSIYASDVNCTVTEVVYFNCSGLKFNGNSVAADFVIQANTMYDVSITAAADNAIVILKTEQIS